ncbi:MAG: hypothetical protein EXS30_08920 [Pedosphaera sp.]|nr:hypothetical protein [Pedosphaera sp.]
MSDRAEGEVLRQNDGEAARLAIKMVSQFKHEAETAGSRFYVVHLPSERDLLALRDTGTFPFADLFVELNRVATVIKPERAMLEVTRGHKLDHFFHDGHYTTNAFPHVVGTIVAEALLASPDVERFRGNK